MSRVLVFLTLAFTLLALISQLEETGTEAAKLPMKFGARSRLARRDNFRYPLDPDAEMMRMGMGMGMDMGERETESDDMEMDYNSEESNKRLKRSPNPEGCCKCGDAHCCGSMCHGKK